MTIDQDAEKVRRSILTTRKVAGDVEALDRILARIAELEADNEELHSIAEQATLRHEEALAHIARVASSDLSG